MASLNYVFMHTYLLAFLQKRSRIRGQIMAIFIESTHFSKHLGYFISNKKYVLKDSCFTLMHFRFE